MLHLYRSLEKKVEDPKTSGMEAAKCCEVAANIANNLLRLESECIKAVKQGLVSIGGQGATTNKNAHLNNNSRNEYDDDDSHGPDTNNRHHHNQQQHHQEQEDNNRKF